jgi:hypothetical protein
MCTFKSSVFTATESITGQEVANVLVQSCDSAPAQAFVTFEHPSEVTLVEAHRLLARLRAFCRVEVRRDEQDCDDAEHWASEDEPVDARGYPVSEA